jgi:hypothetical protein
MTERLRKYFTVEYVMGRPMQTAPISDIGRIPTARLAFICLQ